MTSFLQHDRFPARTEPLTASQCIQEESLVHCLYQNDSNSPHILRSQHGFWFLERTVMPGHQFSFDAPPSAVIEIHTVSATTIFSDNISVKALHVKV